MAKAKAKPKSKSKAKPKPKSKPKAKAKPVDLLAAAREASESGDAEETLAALREASAKLRGKRKRGELQELWHTEARSRQKDETEESLAFYEGGIAVDPTSELAADLWNEYGI
jgi:hypothetical protein